ncbi:MAG: hypothetical protein HYX84_07145 [Chloroflexi bacterium]|nr:hypothetical protein [Chloroflexota bacterium]
MRVVIATEPLEMQRFLADIVEEQPGAVVVGQAENAVRAVTAVDNLDPDVTIIDSNLPYSVGLDQVALSRASGLDVAQGISVRKPGARVVLLTNLDSKAILERTLNPHELAFFLHRDGDIIPFTLQDLGQRGIMHDTPVFASIGTRPRTLPMRTSAQRLKRIGGDAIFLGGLGIIGGLLLTITWLLTPVGVAVTAAGVVSVSFGLMTKLAGKVWPR